MKPPSSDKSAKVTDAKVPPAADDRTASDASPDELDAPEYYSKDRKPRIGTPDPSPAKGD